ncbi:MAG TPA: AAA family ATPase, partial [Virgibacillus sp.]|nr:AAA family ATPase [Virgibacillus sp.]
DVNIGDFSRGMSMKLSLGVALSHDAKLLLLDEATAGLDPVAREDIVEVLREFVHDQKRSILMSSHITSDLETLADRLMFIKEGRLLLQVDKEELINSFGIVTCSEETFSSIDPGIILSSMKTGNMIEVLVSDKRKFDHIQVTSPDSLDHVSVLLMKGEPYERTRIK